MFRLPVCPHCKTVYHYKDTKKATKEKISVCYHCKKEFKASIFPGIFIIGAIVVALNILVNILLLSRMTGLNLLLLFIVTILFLGLIYILLPFFTTFSKTEDSNKKTNKKT